MPSAAQQEPAQVKPRLVELIDRMPEAALLIYQGQLAHLNAEARRLLSVECLSEAVLQSFTDGNTEAPCWLRRADSSLFQACYCWVDLQPLGVDGGYVLLREAEPTSVALAGAQKLAQLERERRNLSAELHDDIAQQLLGAKLLLHSLSTTSGVAGVPPERYTALKCALEESLLSVRRLAYGISPPALGKEQLVWAMRQHLQCFESSAVAVQLEVRGSLAQVADDQALVIFRVFQEALGNAFKHAQASSVLVRLTVNGSIQRLEVMDDGVGFDLQVLGAQRAGLGLANMQARALSLGGKVDIFSQLGTGARVCLHLPDPTLNAVKGEA